MIEIFVEHCMKHRNQRWTETNNDASYQSDSELV